MSSQKRPFATQLDAELLQALRATVVGLQQLDPSLTMGGFVSVAIQRAIHASQDEHNDGRPWPAAQVPPRRGPRLT